MLRRICFFFILFAVGESLQHLGAGVVLVASHPKFHESIYNHTHSSSVIRCNDFENRLRNATKKSQQYFHEHYDPEHHNICNFLSEEFKECLEPITSVLKNCLPENSKDTPEFLVDSMVNLFNFACNAKGSALLELTQPCITHSLSSLCSDESSSKLTEYQKTFPSKRDVCDFETSFRLCVKGQLEEKCDSRATIDNFLKFYDALHEPCKKLK